MLVLRYLQASTVDVVMCPNHFALVAQAYPNGGVNQSTFVGEKYIVKI